MNFGAINILYDANYYNNIACTYNNFVYHFLCYRKVSQLDVDVNASGAIKHKVICMICAHVHRTQNIYNIRQTDCSCTV